MLISDAINLYYGNIKAYRAYLNQKIVWGLNYLKSKGNTSAEGFPVGTVIDKTFSTANRKTLAAYLPGTVDFEAVRSYWTDWGDDIFDSWGFFYIYDPEFNNYRAVVLPNLDSADGVENTSSFSLNGRTFTVKYGYPVQGIFKIDVRVNDREKNFSFGFDGNLGSNGSTINSNLETSYTINSQNLKLHYNYNYQGSLPSESFYTYVVPYEISKNQNVRPFTRHVYITDNLALYTVPLKRGVTIYISKQADVNAWIINDLNFDFD
jgi:hypothetical protein